MEIKTPVGRIVWGNPATSTVKKDQQTNQPIIRDGQPVTQWVFGLAIPKAEFMPLWQAMQQEAMTGFPNGAPGNFSWKIKDGDSVDSKGVPYSKREGYAGCYVLTIATEAFAPPIYKLQNGAYVQLQPEQIKTGDYALVALNIKVNVPQNRTHTPGLYVNPVAIEHVGYGTAIFNGPDAQTLFGGQQHALPPGASATPIAAPNAPGMPGTMPGMPPAGPAGIPPMAPQPMPPMPGQMPGYPPQQPVQQPMSGYAPQPPMQPMPGGMTGMMPGQPQMPPPMPGFAAGAPGQPQMPGYPPQGGYAQPGMYPSPGPATMPGNGGMPSNNGLPAMTGAFPSNPGQMPGMMPPR